jgi:hypothetical protein
LLPDSGIVGHKRHVAKGSKGTVSKLSKLFSVRHIQWESAGVYAQLRKAPNGLIKAALSWLANDHTGTQRAAGLGDAKSDPGRTTGDNDGAAFYL